MLVSKDQRNEIANINFRSFSNFFCFKKEHIDYRLPKKIIKKKTIISEGLQVAPPRIELGSKV